MIEHEQVNLTQNDYCTLMALDNLSFGAHFHHAIEFCYMIDGKTDFFISGKQYSVKKGEAIIVMPNQIHSLKTSDSSKIQIVRIWPELAGSFYLYYKNKVPKNGKFYISHPELVGEGIWEHSNIYEVKALVYSFISDLCSQCKEWIDRDCETSIINDMLKIVETEFDSNISLKGIAKRLNYNYSYLSAKFCSIIGMSFNDYLNNCRINHACWLIKNSDLSITEIAYATGYNSIRSFNRNFYKYISVTPIEYRNTSMI